MLEVLSCRVELVISFLSVLLADVPEAKEDQAADENQQDDHKDDDASHGHATGFARLIWVVGVDGIWVCV